MQQTIINQNIIKCEPLATLFYYSREIEKSIKVNADYVYVLKVDDTDITDICVLYDRPDLFIKNTIIKIENIVCIDREQKNIDIIKERYGFIFRVNDITKTELPLMFNVVLGPFTNKVDPLIFKELH